MSPKNTELIKFSSNKHETPAYLAIPEGQGPFPAVVAIQEWWGLVPHMLEVAERFAEAGFLTIVPDLYHGKTAEEPNEAQKLAMALDRARAIKEISAAGQYLLGRNDVLPKKVGLVGWCMGGALSLSTAAQDGNIGATVCFYGRPLEASDTERLQAPVLGLYGELDGGIPLSMVQDFEKELENIGIEHDIQVYAGAQHAFFNDTRPQAFHAEASEDAWQRTIAWLSKYLT